MTTYLDDHELRELLMKVEMRFSLDIPLASFESVERIESRTSMIYVVSGPGFDPVVVKIGRDWTPQAAERVFDDLQALERLFTGNEEVNIKVAPVIAWHDEPPSVCMGFVPGEELSQLLSFREGYRSKGVDRAMDETGAALGLYHRSGIVAVERDEVSVDYDGIATVVAEMARKVKMRKAPFDASELPGIVARRYGDFAPYNIRVDQDAQVWLFDQPSPPTYAPIHHDVSYFLGRVEGRLGRYETADRATTSSVQKSLDARFLAAYARTGPRPLDTAADDALIAMYRSHRSLMTARKRLVQRRYSEIPRYVRSGLHWRREARRALR